MKREKGCLRSPFVLFIPEKSEKDIIHFSRTIRSAMHGFVTLEEAGFFGTMVDADESYSYMVKTLSRSLKDEYGGGTGDAGNYG